MKTFYSSIVCIICIFCISCIGRAQVRDDFSDGNFTNNPVWTGDTECFEINTSGQLHLNTTGIDTSIMVTRNSSIIDTEWSFWMKLSFNTSANNYARIYLTSDTSSLLSAINGYFVQAGGGDDSVFIMKQTGAAVKTVYRFKTYKTLHSTNTLRFKITRDQAGFWEAMIDTTGGHNYIPDGTFFDDSFRETRWFGLMCRYTSSNATKFYFDDFYIGPIIYDTAPPVIIATEAMTAKILKVSFSEFVQKQSAENPKNYQFVSNGTRPDSILQDILHPDIVSIFIHDPLAQGTIDSLRIRNILDLSFNCLLDTNVQICYYEPKPYDVVIHEIMADPEPPVELPNGEFVELYNRSAFPIQLEDWTFKYGSYSKIFPAINLPSNGYLLIVKDSAYLNFAKCAVLFTSSSSLSNEGTALVLKDNRQNVIHSVAYSPDWYRSSFKEEGGWSLEMMDPLNPCGCIENWGPCKDAWGGTPGRANSIRKANPDERAPIATRAVISDSARVTVTFSEAMDSISLLFASGWTINPSGIHPVGVMPVSPDFSTTQLLFDDVFKKGTIYELRISENFSDCAGNICDTSRSVRFAIPDSVGARDVVINEILSNPASGGARFVELFNRSEKVIDLQTLVIADCDTVSGFLANSTPLTASGYLLFPGDYVAMTSDPEGIFDKYRVAFPEAIAGMTGFPVLGDDAGTVIIARKDNMEILDKVEYNKEMHYPLLTTTEGVSLERTKPDLPSDDKGNWHSAAETAGFATPGYQNSHWIADDVTNQEIIVQPAIFSPDNDGRDDLLIVTIREPEPDYAVNIFIYDSRGRLVGQLANNVVFGSEGVFIWDGMTASRGKAPLGFYILLIELTRPDGIVRKIKRTVVLGGGL